MSKSRIIYLACPYTHPDRAVRERRFQLATETAAALIKRGHIVFSPITMTHPIDSVLAGNASTLGSEFWVTFDEAFMDICSEMIVLDIEGWKRSSGIQREVAYFEMQGKPVRFISQEPDLERIVRAGTEV
jgi:nucleoside 2-deoxyribosyltransferase